MTDLDREKRCISMRVYDVPAFCFFFQAEDGIRDLTVTGVQTCALPISGCKLEMCTVCNTRGCFSSNGVISRVFLEKPTYSAFPATKELTTKWASTDFTVCFVGSNLYCAALKELAQAPSSAGSPVPTVVAPGPLGAPIPQGPRCIVCGVDRIFIDKKAQGAYTIKLVLGVGKNGTVTSVEADRKSTRLNSSHSQISYAVFCLKKK